MSLRTKTTTTTTTFFWFLYHTTLNCSYNMNLTSGLQINLQVRTDTSFDHFDGQPLDNERLPEEEMEVDSYVQCNYCPEFVDPKTLKNGECQGFFSTNFLTFCFCCFFLSTSFYKSEMCL